MNRLIQKISNSSLFDFHDTFIENSDGRAQSRRNIVTGNCFATMASAMCDGVYFTTLMLAMGADDIFIGYVSAALTFVGLFQFFSPMLLSKVPRRKKLLIASRILYHFLNIVVMGGLPLLPIATGTKLGLFVAVLMIKNISSNLVSPALSAWHMQNIPMKKLISHTALFDMASNITSHITAFVAGVFMDSFQLNELSLGNIPPTLSAILLLRAGALVLAVLESISFSRIKETPHVIEKNVKTTSVKLMLEPLTNKSYMRTIAIPMCWTLCASIVGSFFSVYIINDIKLSYSLISLSGMISMPLRLIAMPTWSRLLRKYKWSTLLMIAQFGTALAYILNALVTDAVPYLYFLCISWGAVCGPGISLNHTKLQYANMPQENRISYIGMYSVLIQLITFVGHYIGILFVQFSGDTVLRIFGVDMCSKQYLNLLQCAMMLIVCLGTQIYVRKQKDTFSVMLQ